MFCLYHIYLILMCVIAVLLYAASAHKGLMKTPVFRKRLLDFLALLEFVFFILAITDYVL